MKLRGKLPALIEGISAFGKYRRPIDSVLLAKLVLRGCHCCRVSCAQLSLDALLSVCMGGFPPGQACALQPNDIGEFSGA